MNTALSAEVAICGAGPVGLALAALLVRRGTPAAQITLIDARAPEAARADPRAIALSAGSARILQDIGAWPLAASTIRQIHVSRRGRFGRSLIDSADYGVPALGHVCRYGVLAEALTAACTAAGVRMLRPDSVASLSETEDGVMLTLTSGTLLSARIAVQAEGGLFGAQDTRSRHHDYQQTAIVAQVAASMALPERAFERFTDEGPLALLPQARSTPVPGQPAGLDYALVWCMRPETAARLMPLDDAAFLAALQDAFGERVGRFTAVSARSMFPLGLNADAAVSARTVAIGNAAQTLHPVAGQGLNLGLRDAAVLASLLAKQVAPSALQQFVRERQTDRGLTIRLTDVMARVFASAPGGAVSQGLQGLLGLSLGLVDAVAPARRLLAEQMMYGRR
jgi:2-octaprenyl-6-methoxyphenol hydroxylase